MQIGLVVFQLSAFFVLFPGIDLEGQRISTSPVSSKVAFVYTNKTEQEFIKIACFVFDVFIIVTDRQTDGRTDGRTDGQTYMKDIFAVKTVSNRQVSIIDYYTEFISGV
jgi:hypothetical protein